MKVYITYFDIHRDIGDVRIVMRAAGLVFLWFIPAGLVVVLSVSFSLRCVLSVLNF